jgi:hypothetical protein
MISDCITWLQICKNIKCSTQSKSANGLYIFFWMKCSHQLRETQFGISVLFSALHEGLYRKWQFLIDRPLWLAYMETLNSHGLDTVHFFIVGLDGGVINTVCQML